MAQTQVKTDILILGSGIAGLSFAIKCAQHNPQHTITLLTKSSRVEESNTYYAQGGIAAVWNKTGDSLQQHIADTLSSGAGLGDPAIVALVVEKAAERVQELIEWGTQFDQKEGAYDLAREGGHSAHRILHHKDITGREIVRALHKKAAQQPNISFLTDYFATEFITENGTCHGCYAFHHKTGAHTAFLSRVTLCATGGAGQVYKTTTNPAVATGDGIAMAHRAAAAIENMAFVQFHPTAFYDAQKTDGQDFLISEAVRGAGAVLKTPDGQAFMDRYDPRGSLAPRDVVARAIDTEMKKFNSECVLLDCTSIPEAQFKQHFPTIYDYCMARGLNPMVDMIPVAPAAHYLCGGIKVNAQAQTTLSGLFAVGECASTGLHGANRLASNSLLEAAVFAHEAFEAAQKCLADAATWPPLKATPTDSTLPCDTNTIAALRLDIQKTMSAHVGIVRTTQGLTQAANHLGALKKDIDAQVQACAPTPFLLETRNLACVALCITQAAQQLKQSRGLHYNVDHLPNKKAV